MAENQALPTSYAGYMIRLAQAAELLRLHGNALKKMGAAAPDCLVKPYLKYRRLVLTAAEQLFDAYRREFGQEAFEQLSQHALGFLTAIDAMPEDVTAGPTLGPNWTAEAFGGPGSEVIGGESLGKLGADPVISQAEFWSRTARRVPQGLLSRVLSATEAIAGSTFWRGLGTTGSAILKFAAKRFLWVWFIIDTGIDLVAGGGGSPIGLSIREALEHEAGAGIPMLRQAIDDALRSFEQDYLARTVQQWQAVIKIARATGGNVTLMRTMMEAYDPHVEKPLPLPPTAWDAFMIGDLAGIAVRREKNDGPIAAVALAVGSVLTLYAGGEG